jgi:murein DD-endopeptidase MepM/ murein hydrolase activator NlpD
MNYDRVLPQKIGLFYKIKRWILGKWAISMIYVLSLTVVLSITVYELKLLNTERLVKDIKLNGINYDAFRSFHITDEMLKTAKQRIGHIRNTNPEFSDQTYIDTIGYLTFSILSSDLCTMESGVIDETVFLRGIAKVAGTQSFQELYGYIKIILSDLKYFPVPKIESETEDIAYSDTWFVKRSYGGNRRHEGTDLMDPKNTRGHFPIVSITDGVIENMGWLEQGGYRIGIRATSGGYFYYAHLSSYAPELAAGDEVIAGQLIGFMGDSGYGKEGTVGQFEVHLHVGIYVPTKTGDMSINPYWIMKILENSRTNYTYE